MEGELDRLKTMYGELDEQHLRDLYDERDTLTVDGQMALRHVLAERGLKLTPKPSPLGSSVEAAHKGGEIESGFDVGIPGMFPSGAQAMEKALDPGGERRDGMENLVTFFDGHELARACAALEQDGIDFALEPLERDALAGAPSSFAVWVPEQDRSRAEDLLRRPMGLFPSGEAGSAVPYDDEMMTLGDFDTAAEAERVQVLLKNAGIEHASREEDGVHIVEVRGSDLERGLQVVASGLDLESGAGSTTMAH